MTLSIQIIVFSSYEASTFRFQHYQTKQVVYFEPIIDPVPGPPSEADEKNQVFAIWSAVIIEWDYEGKLHFNR